MFMAIAQLGQLWILSRLLTPSDFGLMGITNVIIGFIQAFSDVGLSNAIIQKPNPSPQQISSLYWMSIFSGILVFGLISATAPWVALFYGEPQLTSLLFWTSTIFLVIPAGQQYQLLLQKNLSFKRMGITEMAGTAAGTLTSIFTAYSGQGVFSLVWGQLANATFRTLLFVFFNGLNWRPRFYFEMKMVRELARFGTFQMGERFLNYFTSKIDQLVIGKLLGTQALGYYTMAANLVFQPVAQINRIISRVAFPVFAQIQDDLPRLQSGYLKVLRSLNSIQAPAMVGLAAVAPQLIPTLLGPKWLPCVPLVIVFAGVAWHQSLGHPLGSLLLARGRVDLSFKINLSLLCLTPGGVYLGALWGGSLGVAVALLCIQLLYWIPHYPWFILPIIGPCGRTFAKTILRPLGMALVMGCGVGALGWWGGAGRLALLAQVLTGIGIYFILCWKWDRPYLAEIRQLAQDAYTQQ
jgi:O-antigen/teichoic acid export membrane protein